MAIETAFVADVSADTVAPSNDEVLTLAAPTVHVARVACPTDARVRVLLLKNEELVA